MIFGPDQIGGRTVIFGPDFDTFICILALAGAGLAMFAAAVIAIAAGLIRSNK